MIFFNEKYSSSNCCSGRVKRSFDDPVENLPRKSQKIFPQALKSAKKDFRKNVSFDCSNGHVKCAFEKPGENDFRKRQDSLLWKSKSDKQRSTTFLQNLFNSKDSSGHVECSLDNPVQNLLTNRRRFVPQWLKKIVKKLFKKENFFSKISYEQLECNFRNPVERIFWQNADGFPLSVRKC